MSCEKKNHGQITFTGLGESTEYTALTHIAVSVKPKVIFFIPDANLLQTKTVHFNTVFVNSEEFLDMILIRICFKADVNIKLCLARGFPSICV